jgi:hypothetical protein
MELMLFILSACIVECIILTIIKNQKLRKEDFNDTTGR